MIAHGRPVRAATGLLAALALSAAWLTPRSAAGAPIYPVKASANGRYLVDQADAPFLMIGDSPQALMVNVSEADAGMFFADRRALGFNTVWINLLCATYTGGRTDASTFDGILPFTATLPSGQPDLTAPNPAYFARVDRMLGLAGQHGIQVLLDPCETGSFLAVMAANGLANCRAYGQFLGTRYRDVPNIVWMSGNDFQSWRNVADDAVVREVALGILDTDRNHLHTVELDYIVSSSLDDPAWTGVLGLNATYTYQPTYARLLQDYARPNFLPSFMVEANYEFESLQGPVTTPPILRKQFYWTMTSGATGQLYGNGYTWPFVGGWQAHLDTPGAAQFGYLKAFFEPRAWFDLVPDTTHAVVTAGYGTFGATGYVDDNDYLTAARTTDGSLVVAYTPILRTFTVDMSALSTPAVAHWFDPSSGVYRPLAGSPFPNTGMLDFTPPGNNADGDGGWVLVLETNPPPIPPPPRVVFVQQASATPQSPQAVVMATFAAPENAGNGNVVAVGWNDETASIASVTDSAGNAYRVAVPTFRGNGLSQAIYYASGIAAGSDVVTVTFDRPANFVDLRAAEYAGLHPTDPFDAGSSATGSGTTADSGPVTTSAPVELLFGAGMTAAMYDAPGIGFTQRVITVPDGDIVEDRLVTVAGPYAATAASSSGAWLMQVAAFEIADEPLLRLRKTSAATALASWPAPSTGYVLEQAADVRGGTWTTVTDPVVVLGAEKQVTVPLTPGRLYFRLSYR